MRRNEDRAGSVLAVAETAYLAGRIAEAAVHQISVFTRPGTAQEPGQVAP